VLRLSIRIPEQPERVFETAEPRVSIGRGHSNLLFVDNPHVSTHHARVEISPRGALLLDVGSTNGSMIQRGPVKIPVQAGGAGVLLEVGDELVLGDSSAPVTLIILDDARPDTPQPMSEPPSTAISAAPVDPSAADRAAARSPLQRRRSGRRCARFGDGAMCQCRGRKRGDPGLTTVVDAAATAIFTLCPALSHLYIGLNSPEESDPDRVFHRVRGQGEAAHGWRPNRALVAKTGNVREGWLVAHSVLELEGEVTNPVQPVPSAICIPLMKQEQPRGVIHVDNRATAEPVDVDDLALVAAVTHIFNLGVDLCQRPVRPTEPTLPGA